MSRLHRLAAALVPPPRREWILAHHAEFDHIQGTWQRRRWMFGLVTITGVALAAQLRSDPRSFQGGTLMKIIVATLSVLNVAAGLGLAVLVVGLGDSPPMVPLLSAVLVIQGGYTLVVLSGVLSARWAIVLEVVGSTLALVAGGIGVVAGIVGNIDPVGGDPEYGPLTVAMLIATHALASLLTFGGQVGDDRVSRHTRPIA